MIAAVPSAPTRTATSDSARLSSASRSAGIEVVAEFYDTTVSGADAVDQRPGFVEMLERVAGNGVKTMIAETANRFARDLGGLDHPGGPRASRSSRASPSTNSPWARSPLSPFRSPFCDGLRWNSASPHMRRYAHLNWALTIERCEPFERQ